MADLAQYLRKAGIEYKDRGTNVAHNNLNICCISCGEGRYHLGIERDQLWGRCWVCGWGGPWGRIAALLRQRYPNVNWNDLKPTGSEYYIEKTAQPERAAEEVLCRPFTADDNDIMEWLTTPPHPDDLDWSDRPRGVPRDIIEHSGVQVGIRRLRGYVVFEQLGSINARRYTDTVNGPRWWKRLATSPFLYGAEWTKKVQPERGYITEGIFDNLRIPIGEAVSILGSVASEALVAKIVEAFPTTKTLVIATDKNADPTQINKLRMMLTDCGYAVEGLDWSRITKPGVKDLDEVYLTYGKAFLEEFLGLAEAEILL